MAFTLVDSNVIVDILTENERWFDWSSTALETAAGSGGLAINPIVYAELSIPFERVEELDDALSPHALVRLPLPSAASFLAGKCYLAYRRAGGTRRSPLPDFYIGAHAAIAGLRLLTRDGARYRAYFPKLELIAP